MSWFWLAAHLILFAAELNVVLVRSLWPRALTGELGPGDRRAQERNARAARRDERQTIVISFGDGGTPHPLGTPERPIAATARRREDAPRPSVDREPPP